VCDCSRQYRSGFLANSHSLHQPHPSSGSSIISIIIHHEERECVIPSVLSQQEGRGRSRSISICKRNARRTGGSENSISSNNNNNNNDSVNNKQYPKRLRISWCCLRPPWPNLIPDRIGVTINSTAVVHHNDTAETVFLNSSLTSLSRHILFFGNRYNAGGSSSRLLSHADRFNIRKKGNIDRKNQVVCISKTAVVVIMTTTTTTKKSPRQSSSSSSSAMMI
jgi:hypothetical protein